MSAVHPHLLWLLPLAAVPVLIHLLIRQRLPRVHWAPMVFLLQALKKNRKRLLLETILLLVARTAIVLAMVLMVVRPLIEGGWSPPGAARRPVTAVVVLDDSASMAATDGLRSRFDRALSRVEAYLDELPADSEVAVVLAAEPVEPLVARPGRDVSLIRELLAARRPRAGGASWPAALDLAGEMVASFRSAQATQVVVTSDFQSSEWEADSQAVEALAAPQADSTLLLVIEPTPPRNIAVAGVSTSGNAGGITSPLLTTLGGSQIAARLEAVTSGEGEASTTVVEMLVDGQKAARREVTLTGGVSSVEFEHRFTAPGEHSVTVRCEADFFEPDNAFHRVVRVYDRVPVLMVDGHLSEDTFASATGFLRAALWPADPDDPRQISLIDPRVIGPGGIESVLIGEYPLIVLADVAGLPTSALQQIRAAVARGAGLLVIAGGQTSPASLAGMLAEGSDTLLPFKPGEPLDLGPDAEPLGIIPVSPLPPMLAPFADPALAEALSRVTFRVARPMAAVGQEVRRLAELSRGGTALAMAGFGKGKVVYLGVPLDRQGGEFPLSPAFVPFGQHLVVELLSGAEIEPARAGEPLYFAGSSGGDGVLIDPEGAQTPAGRLLSSTAGTGEDMLVLPGAELAGVYTLRAGVAEQHRAVNVPASESQLATADPAALGAAIEVNGLRVVGPAEPLRAALAAATGGGEVWTFALLLVATFLLVELGLIWLFAPKKVDAGKLLREATRLA